MTGPTSYLHTSSTLRMFTPGRSGHASSRESQECPTPCAPPFPVPTPSVRLRLFRLHPCGTAPAPFTPSPRSLAPRTGPAFPAEAVVRPALSDSAAPIRPLARTRTFQSGLSDTTARCQAPLFPASTPTPPPLLVLCQQNPLFRLPVSYSSQPRPFRAYLPTRSQ